MQDTPTQKDSQTLPVALNTSATWISVDEFIKLSGLEEARVLELIESGAIVSKKEGENVMIDASSGTSALIKRVENNLVNADMHGKELSPVFVEKTIATILSLHDKVIASKDETISAFKNENAFLKDALVSMQEVYDDDKKTMEVLRLELQSAREEVEFMKRKYRLMWGKVSNMAEGSK